MSNLTIEQIKENATLKLAHTELAKVVSTHKSAWSQLVSHHNTLSLAIERTNVAMDKVKKMEVIHTPSTTDEVNATGIPDKQLNFQLAQLRADAEEAIKLIEKEAKAEIKRNATHDKLLTYKFI
jgi:hypothetical protein|tara:strand:+ start:2107 stop:2478 length:372 start_codon:yes stop_codon:yes gene_type:complete